MSSESNSPETGDPRSMTEVMQATRALIPSRPLQPSQTGLERGEGETRNAPSPDGRDVFVSGSMLTPSAVRLRKAFDLPGATAKLLHLLAPLLVWGDRSIFGSHGYERAEITDVVVRQGASREDLIAAYVEVESMLTPCRPEVAAGKLAELRSMTVTRQRDGVDMDVAAGAYTSRLAQYPFDVVVSACDAWADREQFWPSWAELKEECAKRMHGREQLRDALRKALA